MTPHPPQQPPQWNGTPTDQTIPSYQSQPPQYPQHLPPPVQNRAQGTSWWSRSLAWFGGQSLPVRIASGCGSLLVACVICSCVGTALGSGSTSTTASATATTGTGIAQATQALTYDATATLATTTIGTATGTTTTAVRSATATPKPAPAPTNTPAPRPAPTNTPVPQPPPQPTCIPGAVNCNPWGYNFTPGNLIYSPPSNFCGYFNCISNFWNGRGYVMQCNDGMFSKSGGISGSCSYHQGNKQPLYSH